MFALVPVIRDRLQAALGAGWQVGDGTQPHDRRPLPRAVVLMQAPDVATTSGPGVSLTPRYVVQLAARAEPGVFAQVDAAFDAAIAQLHHWRPDHAAHRVGRLQLQAARDLESLEQGLFGYELLFTTSTARMGWDE